MAKTVKTPGLTIYLEEHVSHDADVAKLVHSMLEYTVLGDVVKLTEIHYDPEITSTVVEIDWEFVKEYYETGILESEDVIRRLSPWVLRMELNNDIIADKRINMNEINKKI